MKIKCAIIGSGNIGCDLTAKIIKNKSFECLGVFVRKSKGKNIDFLKKIKVRIIKDNISILKKIKPEIIFDASSAEYHVKNFQYFKKYKFNWIDLTPSGIGTYFVPNTVNTPSKKNISCITCGAQSSIPLIFALKKIIKKINYVELVSTISAKSAGYATRMNIDKYLTTTESAIKEICKIKNVKVILNINPSNPPINMINSISFQGKGFQEEKFLKILKKTQLDIQKYVKNYQFLYDPEISKTHARLSVSVKGGGDYLPAYAGNLDIITSAAIQIAKKTVR